jgi:hypothetical protein
MATGNGMSYLRLATFLNCRIATFHARATPPIGPQWAFNSTASGIASPKVERWAEAIQKGNYLSQAA